MGQDMPRKSLTAEAAAKLLEFNYPGNVRELMHVLERGTILCGERREIEAGDIRFRRATRS
jgi:transcriptional regulator with PAS, ATPase and Fis domain